VRVPEDKPGVIVTGATSGIGLSVQRRGIPGLHRIRFHYRPDHRCRRGLRHGQRVVVREGTSPTPG
jgi:hypothetical protein